MYKKFKNRSQLWVQAPAGNYLSTNAIKMGRQGAKQEGGGGRRRKSRRRKTRRRKYRRRKTRRRKSRRKKRGGFLKRRKFNIESSIERREIEGYYPNSETIKDLVKKAKTAFNIPANSPDQYGLHERSLEWTPSHEEPLPPAINTNKKITKNFP